MEDNKEQVVDIESLVQDDKNFNSGTEAGAKLMEKSFAEFGAGRSILLDKNNNIIAGNKSQGAAIAAGIKKVRIIETTGDELVAVKRVDVDLDSEQGRKMALADNATSAANLEWDKKNIQDITESIDGFDVNTFGIGEMIGGELEQLGDFYTESGIKQKKIIIKIPIKHVDSRSKIENIVKGCVTGFNNTKVVV